MIHIIQAIDHFFQIAIVIPLVFVLLYHFHIYKKEQPKIRSLHKLCVILIVIFLIRCFLAQFIFTPVNYDRFVNKGYFPLVESIFYSE